MTMNNNQVTKNIVDKPVFFISGGFMLIFCLIALIDLELVKNLVNTYFGLSIKYFGLYWQVLLLLTFFIGLYLAFSKYGNIRLGNLDKPEISTFRWSAMTMCTLLAGGGVFWAAAEPIAHFLSTPPLFGIEAKTKEAIYPALAQTFLHWGFLAWAILGSLTTIIIMYYCYNKNLPLKPRVLLYPVFGEKALKGPLAIFADVSCIIAVVAGTVGPIGFLSLQVGYGLNDLFNIPNNLFTQIVILMLLVSIYVISAVTGVSKGIQLLSRFNVILAFLLMVYILLLGPTAFIFDSFLGSWGVYLDNFFLMTTYRSDTGWLSWWTVFFWGWFLGYGPLMAIFLARISRGRKLRELIVMLSILAPVITNFWFTIVGGSGIFYELANPGVISTAFEGFNLPATLLAITKQLPAGFLISILFLILTTAFVATTGDSMTLSISMCTTGSETPVRSIRIFWGVIMGLITAVLLIAGSGGVGALQSFIVITAVPVSLVLLPSLWNAPQIAVKMWNEQKNTK